MSIITLSLKDEVEKELRRLAAQKYGKSKGSLSKIVEEGLIEVSKKTKPETFADVFLRTMKEVDRKKYGGLMKHKREDLYER